MRKDRPENRRKKATSALSDTVSLLIQHLDLMNVKFPPFETWDDLREAHEESGLSPLQELSDNLPESLEIALQCLHMFQMYVASCVSTFLAKLARKTLHENPKGQASFTLLSGIATDLGAIEHLCREGYDLQARVIVRTLRERIDCLIASNLDRSFAVAFVKCTSPSENNAFWHKRVSRGKLQKLIERRLTQLSLNGENPIDEYWKSERKKFDEWLGQAAHPSHVSGLLAMFPQFSNEGEREGWFDENGLFGKPSALSISTLRAAMSFAQELILLAKTRGFLVMADEDAGLDGMNDLTEIAHSAERFLLRCTANSYLFPNLALHQLQLYLEGYMLVPKGEEFDAEKYKIEMIDHLISVLENGRNHVRELIAKIDDHT